MNSLMCSAACGGRDVQLNLVQSICLSISSWCDSKLQDYHLNFSQVINFACFVSNPSPLHP